MMIVRAVHRCVGCLQSCYCARRLSEDDAKANVLSTCRDKRTTTHIQRHGGIW